MSNKNNKVIQEFGEEWTEFDYSKIDKKKLKQNFDEYFSILPNQYLSTNSIGFDMGCGTGRWAQFIAPKVKHLNCIEPSDAIEVAKSNLTSHKNITFLKETTDLCSLKKGSQDFGYCLGVLHHIPNTLEGLKDCSDLLKSGGPLLLYLYYNFENKPYWFKLLWKVSDLFRKLISTLPKFLKMIICNGIAYTVYFPLSKVSYFLEKIKINVDNIPLSEYRHKPFYQSKNDALDRFGTRLEQRFSKTQIEKMLKLAGFENIKFSSNPPYWCCVAYKKK